MSEVKKTSTNNEPKKTPLKKSKTTKKDSGSTNNPSKKSSTTSSQSSTSQSTTSQRSSSQSSTSQRSSNQRQNEQMRYNPILVLLEAIEIAQRRGAFSMKEIGTISEAHQIVSSHYKSVEE